MRAGDHSFRAGFWRRLLAFLIDFALVLAILGLAGLLLAPATNGKIRVTNTVIDFSRCDSAILPAELQLPSGFNPTSVAKCTKSFLGIEHDWVLAIAERKVTGPNRTYTRSVALPLDPAGQLANPFYLDVLDPILLAIYLIWAERRFATSIGKRALGLTVRSVEGKRLTEGQAAKRTILFLIPITLYQVPVAYFMMFDSSEWAMLAIQHESVLAGILVAGILLLLAFAINFIVTSWRRTLPWHDEWAGTEVIHLTGDIETAAQTISETFR